MQKTLQQILQDIGALIDQDTTLPTGTELTVRVAYANKALEQWGKSYEWKSLRRPDFAPTVLLSATSFALPVDFVKPMSALVDVSKTTDNVYEFIDADERFAKLSSDRYAYVTGDPSTGYSLIVNPAVISGASLVMDYRGAPSSMATLQDICVCPDPDYIVKRAEAMILEARSDPRYPTSKEEARQSLAAMIEDQDAGSQGETNQVPDRYKQSGFVIGED